MVSASELPKNIKICIDRGGTFTDCLGMIPGRPDVVIKLLSEDPSNYEDAPTEGIRRILEAVGYDFPRGKTLDLRCIESIRCGTTVATNALLERKGERCAMLITKGLEDLLEIGNQSRPALFDLAVKKPQVLYSEIVEVDERVVIETGKEDPSILHEEPVFTGVSGDKVRVLKALDENAVTKDLKRLYEDGYRSVAICLAHGYTFQDHERTIATIARKIGFTHVSVSSELQPMLRMVPRASSACADAYLSPKIREYVNGFAKSFGGDLDVPGGAAVEFMQSDGGLVNWKNFSGLRAILSGPAGGVVGFAKTSFDEEERTPIIGFDMGGTSTDVSRYGGQLEHIFETVTGGVTIQSPQLDINTIAAGGGSILHYVNGLFVIGPDSAGAHPGPASYRKGGPLCVTDANLMLGRIVPDYFPKIFGPNENLPLDVGLVRQKFAELTKDINAQSGVSYTPEQVASGFLQVADASMSRPIRGLTEARGYPTHEHYLSCFGGAGGQHACSIAAALGIPTVIIHKYSSILSSYGMALADVVSEAMEPSIEIYSAESMPRIHAKFAELKAKVAKDLIRQNVSEKDVDYEVFLNLRYKGTDTSLMILEPSDGSMDFKEAFLAQHMREFSFVLPGADILVDDIRVRGFGHSAGSKNVRSSSTIMRTLKETVKFSAEDSLVETRSPVYFESIKGFVDSPIYKLEKLKPGTTIAGPAIMLDDTQTVVVHPSNTATILKEHVIIDIGLGKKPKLDTKVADPIMLSIFSHRFMSIAEQMGRALQKTSVSLQIKERLDFSCAIFGPDAELVANAPHVPVHLGAMQYAVSAQIELFRDDVKPGDVWVSNHPEEGGTHLPDITVIMPVFDDISGEIVFYAASRGHHGDIGGLHGNSMPPMSTELWQEGACIRSTKLVSEGVFNEAAVREAFAKAGEYPDCIPSRRIQDNISDLKAQCSACAIGAAQIKLLFKEYGKEVVQFYMEAIRKNAEMAVRNFMKETRSKFNGEPMFGVDSMDDGSPIHLKVAIDEDGFSVWDFEGTGCEAYNNFNAPWAVARSAILYCIRTMTGTDMPMNAGCLAPTKINIPRGTILYPSEKAAVCSGNTDGSQRTCDVIFKTFKATAASQGCMNVLHFANEESAYGETICGGHGAGPTWQGADAVHINMTNTRITDLELIEKRYPAVIRKFGIRHGSGGAGRNRGGNGSIREIEFRSFMDVAVIGERRITKPYGMLGGECGATGRNLWLRRDADKPNSSVREISIGGRAQVVMGPGDYVRILSPGGGGWGTPNTEPAEGEKIVTPQVTQFPRAQGSLANRKALEEGA